MEIAKIEYVLRGLEQLREPTVSRLEVGVDSAPGYESAVAQTKEFDAAPLDYERLVTLLGQKNPELAGLNFEAMAAKSRIELAKKNFYPDIGVGVEWTSLSEAVG